jgi:hypothetical protein
MLTTCSEPGCATLVLGGRCIEHERPATRVFVRGRPLVGPHARPKGGVYGTRPLATTGVVRTHEAHDGVPVGLASSRN